MRLFDIAPKYEQVMQILEQMEIDGCSQDEILEAMAIVSEIQDSFNDKCFNIAAMIRNTDAEVKALIEARDAMDKRRKSAVAKSDRLRKLLKLGMDIAGVKKIDYPEFVIAIKNNPESVKIADDAKIPDEYLRHKKPEPDKNAIKEALKGGGWIDGCSLECVESMSIK